MLGEMTVIMLYQVISALLFSFYPLIFKVRKYRIMVIVHA